MALIETNFIRPQEVYDRNTGESKVRYRSYDGNDRFIPVVEGENGVPKTLVEVTHAELKAMRDAGKLTPGGLYRITDYNCTTTQENTQSAGHQFDIVLLALSEDKLAEEGWAMMHDNIYDVTFADGVTKKCYAYKYYSNDEETYLYNIVDITSLLGIGEILVEDEAINEASKSISLYDADIRSNKLDQENLTYNYFQNSNLSAWKVWYCLDNDKSRFAWADDSVDEGTPAHEDTGLPNGRGVIYRLIDEFNNDIKYDFKNIQFKRKITDGQYDANGTETWCYTLNLWYNDICQDASIVGNTLLNDEGYINGVHDNKFGYATAYDLTIEGVDTFAFALGDNAVLSFDDGGYFGIFSNTIGNSFYNNTIGNEFNNNTIGNRFASNTIGVGFNNNTIGNSFINKTISDNTNYKNYGNSGVELATKE